MEKDDIDAERPQAVIQRFLSSLLNRKWQGFKIIHHAVLPARDPCHSDLAIALHEELRESLRQAGITKLYRHQTDALEHIRAGEHVVVATPTSSGKSLIYNLAVAEALLEDPRKRALYLFPIKALSRDQLEAVQSLFQSASHGEGRPPFRAAIYDGDTTPYQRAKIRQQHPHALLLSSRKGEILFLYSPRPNSPSVFGEEDFGGAGVFDGQAGRGVLVPSSFDGLLGRLDGQGGVGGNLPGQKISPFHHLILGGNFIEQADPQGFPGIDAIGRSKSAL